MKDGVKKTQSWRRALRKQTRESKLEVTLAQVAEVWERRVGRACIRTSSLVPYLVHMLKFFTLLST